MKSLNTTVFTPEVPQGNDKERLQTGTTTIGLICKDCVILAADKRATAGHLIVDKKVQKVRQVTDHIAVTTAGSVSDLQLLFKYLSAELKLKQIRNNREASVREAANLLSSWVYHLIRSSGGIAHFLVGGYDKSPRLFDIYPDGSLTEVDDYVVSGSGSLFALGVLENKFTSELSSDEGVKLALEAINAALARDSASGNGVDVFILNKDGAEHKVKKIVNTTV